MTLMAGGFEQVCIMVSCFEEELENVLQKIIVDNSTFTYLVA